MDFDAVCRLVRTKEIRPSANMMKMRPSATTALCEWSARKENWWIEESTVFKWRRSVRPVRMPDSSISKIESITGEVYTIFGSFSKILRHTALKRRFWKIQILRHYIHRHCKDFSSIGFFRDVNINFSIKFVLWGIGRFLGRFLFFRPLQKV